ncbi:MAG TPA: type II toxin-antitoxin system VapC family toxin [Longimicrobium sp.]|nr:type II toxin-antitoxin system VapC family toxin [Longimicrobium sp.]
MALYALDTNLYIAAIRDPQSAAELSSFYSLHAPRCYLVSVVLHELLLGAKTREKRNQLHGDIASPFVRTKRIVTPSHQAWAASGEALSRIAEEERIERKAFPRSFINDAILAACCRENGITLVTANLSDFARIARVMKVEFTAPWPA